MKFDDLPAEKQQQIKDICNTDSANPIPCFETSTQTNVNITELKQEACRMLLKKRVDMKLKSFNKADQAAKRIKVFYPESWTEDQVKKRQQAIEESVPMELEIDTEKLQKEADELQARPRSAAKLPKPDQVHDKIPEFYKGYNVSDFIHPDVTAKMAALANEEKQRHESGFYELPLLPDDEEARHQRQLVKLVREKKMVHKLKSRLKSKTNLSLPRTHRKSALLTKALQKKEYKDDRYFSKNPLRALADASEKVTRTGQLVKANSGMQIDLSAKEKAIVLATDKTTKKINKNAYMEKEKRYTKEPKHLFTGKMNSVGKRDWR